MNSPAATISREPIALRAARSVRAENPVDSTAVGLVHAATLAIWIGCLVGGMTGVLVPYAKAKLPVKEPPPVIAEQMKVDLTPAPALNDVSPAQTADPSAVPPEAQTPDPPPPPPAEAAAPPDAPPLAALDTPAIAFAMPVAGPSRVASAQQAAPTANRAPPAPPRPIRLTFGVGQGAQPNPEYPREAILAGQTGTVVIRFTAGEDGRVTSVEVATPSRWPLLNEAAAPVVRTEWRFKPGPERVFLVPIQFQLNER